MKFNPISNLPTKIGAVVLAFLLWVHVATNQSYEHVVEIPLQVVNVPSGLILTSDVPAQLTIQVRATGKQLFGILTDEMVYRLDLADYKAGQHSLELNSASVMEIIPSGYEDVELLSPRRISLMLEKEDVKELPVATNLQVIPAQGYIVMGNLTPRPERVTVAGPESVLKKLREIGTEPLTIEGLVANQEVEIPLKLPDTLQLSTVDSSVIVIVRIEPRDERRFENISVDPPRQFNESSFAFIPGSLNLALGIPRSLVDSVNVEDISVSFESPESPRDSTRVPLRYDLPDRVNLIESSADSVLIFRKS